MTKFLLGVAVGAAMVGALFLLWLVPETRTNSRAVGFNNGRIDARWEIASAIERELGRDVSEAEPYEPLFGVKSSAVVIVERDGVKTVRVLR